METEFFFLKFFKHIMIEKDNGTILMIKMAKMNYLVLVMIFVYIVCYFGWILFLVLGCLYLMFSFMRCASLFVVMSTTISYTMSYIEQEMKTLVKHLVYLLFLCWSLFFWCWYKNIEDNGLVTIKFLLLLWWKLINNGWNKFKYIHMLN